MNEKRLFKNSLEMKRLVWIQGPKGTRKLKITYEMLRLSGLSDHSIAQINPQQFIDVMKRGIVPVCSGKEFPVFIIRKIDSLNASLWNSFLSSLSTYYRFRDSYSFRVILISSRQFKLSSNFQAELNPVIIRIAGIGDDPSDLNERIHALIDEASRVTGQRVRRISEGVATFLETFPWELNDEELLEVLVCALLRLKGSELRLEHFFPNQHAKPSEMPIRAFL